MPIESLFSQFGLRDATLANRFVMAPMTRCWSPNGVPGPDVAAYYRRRAEGGVGLIVTEGTRIPHPVAVDYPDAPQMFGEAALGGWKRVVDDVHKAGARIFPQLWHQGAMFSVESGHRANPPMRAARPSGIWGPPDGRISIPEDMRTVSLPETAPMSEEEIQDIITAFGRAAYNAKALGFDGIAIHGAHGYLIDSFLWDYTNCRADGWGGSRANRARFGAEVVRAIRRAVGEEMPICLRFSQFKMQDYGARLAATPDEMAALLGPLADAGVDLFDASQRYFDTPAFPGSDLNLAGWAKKLTGKASATVGGIGLGKAKGAARHIDPSQDAANNLARIVERFECCEFDLVCVGRSLLNDADWLHKARAGEDFLPFNAENLQRLA